MISRDRINHASTCMDLALEHFENGNEEKSLEYIQKCLDDLYFIVKCET